VCDIQETFRPVMTNYDSLIKASSFLIKSGLDLGIPILISEQQPFKPTVQEIQQLFSGISMHTDVPSDLQNPEVRAQHPNVFHYTKTRFSMWSGLLPEFDRICDPKDYVLFGIEAHVCVKQTCLDLLSRNKNVYIVLDAIESQNSYDRATAIQAMVNSGAIPVTAEGLVYELMRDAKHPKFKAILQHVKEYSQYRRSLKPKSDSQL